MTRYRIGRIIIELRSQSLLSEFGYPCGNTFIPDRAKCYTDPRTGARLKVPLTKQQIDKVRSRSKGAEKLYSEQESRVRRLARSDAAEKGMRFPTSTQLDAADIRTIGAADPDTKINNMLATTPDGRTFYAKGNVTEYGSRNSKGDAWFARTRKSEIATKEIADRIGLGKYFLPVTERSVDIFKDGSGMRTPVILTPYIENATKYKQNSNIFDNQGLMDYSKTLASPSKKGAGGFDAAKKIVDAIIGDTEAADLSLSRVGKDANKLLAFDYILGNLDRKLPLVPHRAGAYMVDNGLNFTPAQKIINRTPGHKYAALTPNVHPLLDLVDSGSRIDKSILDAGDDIIKIAKKHGLPVDGVVQRLKAMNKAKIWRSLLF